MREWTTVDKSGWKYGQDEPDKVQYKDEVTGFDCLIVRNHGGALCGYVGVPKEHPFHGKHYDDLHLVAVHGGLTFAGGCQHTDDPSVGICHIPEPGEPDNIWWLGFDCAHAWDICPAYHNADWHFDYPDSHYRDIAYVKREIADLALQLQEGR